MTDANGHTAANAPAQKTPDFASLGLPRPLLNALEALGFDAPTPIQAQAIPALLEGRDLLGQAQTGTGKTGAFALPLLARLDTTIGRPQVLVLAPTRELALQVNEACDGFARHLGGYRATTLYGGQPYGPQLRDLSRGVQWVVGTPGRVMDHIKRGSLDLSALRAVVLDEADEMLRMGFIDDVAWILEQTPDERQVALFSATMPAAVKRIAERHLRRPVRVTIASRTATAATVRQRFCVVDAHAKTEALIRLLETEDMDAGLIFVRTKAATVELADALSARGFPCEALSGDIPQKQREQVVERLRNGRLKLLAATDVVARGLDVERIGHVFNYDLPTDPESYVHRIGRTGRAGRKGEAISLVTPRERRLLKSIERVTRQAMTPMPVPSAEAVQAQRARRLKTRVLAVLEGETSVDAHQGLLRQWSEESGETVERLAAALLHLLQGESPAPLAAQRAPRSEEALRDPRHRALRPREAVPMARYRVAVGRRHGIRPGNLVGAIANEGELASRLIGHIDIRQDHSLVDLPRQLDADVVERLRRARVAGQRLELMRVDEGERRSRRTLTRPSA